jgi:serine/threonine protein kinase
VIHVVHNLELYVRILFIKNSFIVLFLSDFKPPEAEYVYQSDIWALGCTIIEMLTGKVKFYKIKSNKISFDISVTMGKCNSTA